MRKYRNQSLSCGHFVKKPSTFRLGIDLETDNPSKTNYPSAGAHMGSCRLLARLTNESASYEFCSIIRLSTEFILETDYPSRRIILLQYKFGHSVKSPKLPTTALTALFEITRILKFKSQPTLAFFACVNHRSGPLRKQ